METPDELRSNAEVEQLKAEISETQAELQQTVAAIQDRLSPAHLKDQATTTMRDATIGRVQHMMNRNNPIPYALIGIGAAWLFASYRSNRQWSGDDDASWKGRAEYGSTEYGSTEYVSDDDELRSYGGTVRASADDWQSASSTDRRPAVTERARQVATSARQVATRARSRWDTMLEDNPMALGIAALAAGALVGATLPSTEVENEYLGTARDTAVESAKTLAQNTVQKVTGAEQGEQQSQQGQQWPQGQQAQQGQQGQSRAT